MELNSRQQHIVEIVKSDGPITGEKIAEQLNLTRATLRPDLAILTMAGFLEARPRVGYFYSGKSSSQLLTEKFKKYVVKDYQSQPVILKSNVTVYEAICSIFIEDVGTLFIVNEDNELVGVCSRKDLLRASMAGQDIHSMPVNIIMTRMPNIVLLKENDLVLYAARQMIHKEIDSIPIVREKDNGKFEVTGRISKTTITKLFVSLFD
ncbi:helix-turn-helix transcriptional regulator [Staphylococcus pseudintermedius]|uniref:helix-turn-helix transcriptional regulator n=1 Tax=Staphylococcus pseudintermedius TaxID=283734 RepID=UPI0019338059|nr:helix-turn-helix transcriptional regulator [Staphylococcus pseudintermedius]EGQ2871747.1 helix-turn-helix transcriptional regulator [Staphylococcus pseudintermedius]EGQ3309496.1 helix-turn-helix transcriptional regulator [Staphylococcus pseudintermedius]EGQ3409524.1 helix-turn-helix transcriptional regulator [Staphylococcus pseudintermedius]EGQ4132317.1 helix-turn-helix transcriptional regulator [Staphylococcus pseudintermedius]EGQ4163394.1 helix-turn-helix transcriptional regulator [Staphy